MNSFLSIYLFYFIIVYSPISNFRGDKNRGSMDLVHDRGSMDPVHILMNPVHGPGPRRGSMDQGSMFCTFPQEATSFPGSLILPPRASEERPWSGLVMCIPESGRLQVNC